MPILCLSRVDDVRLKAFPVAARLCSLCNLCAPDYALHVVLQCPTVQPDRVTIFLEIRDSLCDFGRTIRDTNINVFKILLWRRTGAITADDM